MPLPRNFRKLSPHDRREAVREAVPGIDPEAFGNEERLVDLADVMVESSIGYTAIPVGIAHGFLVNDRRFDVPMATEEPSVIAAASFAAGIVARNGGFTVEPPQPITTGQLYISGCDSEHATLLMSLADTFADMAAEPLRGMTRRGGGWRGIDVDFLPEIGLLRVHVHVDVRDAMGANAVNTVVETLRSPIEKATGGTVVMAILSNAAAERVTTATFSAPVDRFARGGRSGSEVADRIALASEIARTDPSRAVTHNKGIMNGVSALALATGNDTRAIEAGAHAYAARDGVYRSLSAYTVSDGMLHGRLEMPIAVGTVGGAAGIHPASAASLALLGNPSGSELAAVACAVGLAQNLAALYALVSEGIQAGHMRLHAERLAWAVGATAAERPAVVARLQETGHYSREEAAEALAALRSSRDAP